MGLWKNRNVVNSMRRNQIVNETKPVDSNNTQQKHRNSKLNKNVSPFQGKWQYGMLSILATKLHPESNKAKWE